MSASKPQSQNMPDSGCGGCGCGGGCSAQTADTGESPQTEWSAEAHAPVALVTGGALRIGAAICRTLCLAGYDVLIHCNRSIEAARVLQAEFLELGAASEVLTADLADGDQIERLMQDAWRFADRLDLVVNNASVFSRQPLESADAAEFDRQWRVNALAPILITRAYAREMRVRRAGYEIGTGCVVNLLDRRVATDEAGCLAYLTSKKALAAFSRSAALELAPDVRVNGVAPGAVLPPSAGVMSETAGDAPLPVRCLPEDVARAVLYLAQSECVTGQTMYVDGGQHLQSVATVATVRG